MRATVLLAALFGMASSTFKFQRNPTSAPIGYSSRGGSRSRNTPDTEDPNYGNKLAKLCAKGRLGIRTKAMPPK